MHALVVAVIAGLAGAVQASSLFPFETVQLGQADIGNYSALNFGDLHAAQPNNDTPSCRAWPGSQDWPSDAEWKQLNITLGGALLRPVPVGSVCYQGEAYNAGTCRYLVQQAGRTHFWIDDPLSVLTQWPQGNTCPAVLNAKGNCTRGGSPEYVVNAASVKDVQVAVNFARNKNVRLVIKNTGHDFGGRSTGAGSLSIWVHNLKSFEFVPEYASDVYTGPAVRVGAGVESWELFNHMADHNITVVSPGGSTVGAVGGWLASGGHGILTSKYGLGADQALALNIVTPDGRFLTADSTTNQDLFWALRGGGPSTYGVVTSVVLKAHAPISVTSMPVTFSVGQGTSQPASPFPDFNFTSPLNFTDFNFTGFNFTFPNITGFNFTFPNITGGFNGSLPGFGSPPAALSSVETFWKGVSITYRFNPRVIDAGGYCYSYIYSLGNNSFSFTSSASIPGLDNSAVTALMQPLYDELNAAGIKATMPTLSTFSSFPYAGGSPFRQTGGGDSPVNTRYRSRLFPRANWADDGLFARTFAAIRRAVDVGGYTFHGIAYGPTLAVAGSPGADSAVNPAWRSAVLHGSLMQVQPVALTAAQARAFDADVEAYVDVWRALTPGSGAYMAEGDPAEPNWQQSFYGADNYPRLLDIKRRYDPWGIFWARTTVGSESWDVRTADGYPNSQNGRLCRVSSA
ncbi:hypothetical protein B0T24DRAFT_690417 [Lasiosphaeria ovina]|uniref:FAD-binding PCMH-type domain-containing protein n=1 Tax=Lasiosphaeria ovina TaxID=92902 RepID=A0AAE0JUA5_9PEZI|nr:hypothetical protein B0T24DRAFT_690417 [Lasiosphaeria ovina]